MKCLTLNLLTMKIVKTLTLGTFAFLLLSISGCDSESVEPIDIDSEYKLTEVELTENELTEDENFGLAYMREEEKLARDVYISLFETYDIKAFDNISKSEQRHMDDILTLLEKYNIADPSLTGEGQFSNATLQKLYDDLIEQGSDSEIAALIVGATIEDLDIKDLEEFEEQTTNPDIISVYESLMCGSRNHLRSFISQLDTYGVTYTPQFISQEEFDSIIAGDSEKCGQSNE